MAYFVRRSHYDQRTFTNSEGVFQLLTAFSRECNRNFHEHATFAPQSFHISHNHRRSPNGTPFS